MTTGECIIQRIQVQFWFSYMATIRSPLSPSQRLCLSGKVPWNKLFDNLQVLFRFADGEEQPVPSAYIEFAERAPLPQFAHLPVCAPSIDF